MVLGGSWLKVMRTQIDVCLEQQYRATSGEILLLCWVEVAVNCKYILYNLIDMLKDYIEDAMRQII